MPNRSLPAAGWIVVVLGFIALLVWYNRRTRRISQQASAGETRLLAYLVLGLSKNGSGVTGIGVRRQWPAFWSGGLASGVLSLDQDGLTFLPKRLARLCGVAPYSQPWSAVHHVAADRDPLRGRRARISVFVTSDASVVFEVEPAVEAARALRLAPVQAQLTRL